MFSHAGNTARQTPSDSQKQFNLALPAASTNRRDDVQIPKFRRSNLFENGFGVQLRMWRRVVAAVKCFLVTFLFPMIREWLAGNLPSRQSWSIRNGGEEYRLHCALAFQKVSHR